MPSNTAIPAKSLTLLEDQMQHEYTACKKAEYYAQTFTDPGLKNLANTMAQHHKTHFERLYNYLSSHA